MNSSIRVLALTGGQQVASARFRIRQYIPALKKYGIYLKEAPAPWSTYPPSIHALRPFWLTASLMSRIPHVYKSWSYDVSILQREFISTYKTFELFTKRPRIFDVDDAIWIYRGGQHIEDIARGCDLIICGNAFLAERFSLWNSQVKIIPTAVDTNRFKPAFNSIPTNPFIIGWTGGSSGLKELMSIESQLKLAIRDIPNSRLRVVCNKVPTFKEIPEDKIEFIKWSPDIEVEAIQGMSVGLMPLEDTEWNRGKCSYKMLLFMSCSLPVIVSPTGMNKEIMKLGQLGIIVSRNNSWHHALLEMFQNNKLAQKMGKSGRTIIEKHFDIKVVSHKLSNAIKSVVAKN
jgi:glycosyltransferase involved in cell wall biosynthesis